MKLNCTVEQMTETSWFYRFTDTNEKGESLIIELTKCEDVDFKDSLPKLWKKYGYIDRVLKNHWNIMTYVKDTEGNSFNRYNPQHKLNKNSKRSIIDFKWMFEANEENKEELINEVYKLFSEAKGKTATQEKNKRIKEYAIKNNIDIYKTIPKNWEKIDNYFNAPIGTVWISNKKSFFKGDLKKGILFIE